MAVSVKVACRSMTATDCSFRAITMLLILVEVSVKVHWSNNLGFIKNEMTFIMLKPGTLGIRQVSACNQVSNLNYNTQRVSVGIMPLEIQEETFIIIYSYNNNCTISLWEVCIETK